MKTLHTTRLLLRPWEVSDAQALYIQAHNPIIGRGAVGLLTKV